MSATGETALQHDKNPNLGTTERTLRAAKTFRARFLSDSGWTKEDAMTRQLTWHEEWSLHIDVLDTDHRGIIERFAEICARFGPDASDVRSGDAIALIGALTDLGEVAREHFEREEELMQAVGYEDIAEHRTEHALLMAEYTDMLRHWRAEEIHILDEVKQESVRDWILDHVLGADSEFAKAFFQLDDPFDATQHRRAPAGPDRTRLSAARRGL
jgi:hemerythrin-like metal-binding protein